MDERILHPLGKGIKKGMIVYRYKPNGSRQYWHTYTLEWCVSTIIFPEDQEVSYESTWAEPEEES